MQRPIKFRGKKSDGSWVYGHNVQRGQYAVIWDDSGYEHIVDRETVGQLIGLKDKNNVDIYERDIIQKTNAQTGQKTGKSTVRYNVQSARFTGLAQGTSKNMEIIGNIYEYPQQ